METVCSSLSLRTAHSQRMFKLSKWPFFSEPQLSGTELRNKTHAQMVSEQPKSMLRRPNTNVHGPYSQQAPQALTKSHDQAGCLVLSSLLVMRDRLQVIGGMQERVGRGEGSRESGLGACRTKPYRESNEQNTARPLKYGLSCPSLARLEEIAV